MINKHTYPLQKSYVACEQIMAEHSRSFFQAFRLLPKDCFQGVAALYAFNRYVDDLADEPTTTTEQANKNLTHLEQTLKDLYTYDSLQSAFQLSINQLSWWPAFIDTLITFKVPLEPLLSQIRGQRFDLENGQINSTDDLMTYATDVAGSVGLMIAPMLLAKNQVITVGLEQACVNLGIGMQITNILRDVGEDYRLRRRIYLPKQLRIKYGVSEEMIARLALGDYADSEAVVIPQPFINLWEDLSQQADSYYQGIQKYMNHFHPKAQLPIISAALTYQYIEEVVRKNGYNCLTKRNYTTASQREVIKAYAKKWIENFEQREDK